MTTNIEDKLVRVIILDISGLYAQFIIKAILRKKVFLILKNNILMLQSGEL